MNSICKKCSQECITKRNKTDGIMIACSNFMPLRTNADRIRAMDYDSLLDFFVELSGNVGCPPNEKSCCDKFERYGRDACRKCWDNYLTSPVEEDT